MNAVTLLVFAALLSLTTWFVKDWQAANTLHGVAMTLAGIAVSIYTQKLVDMYQDRD